VRLDLVAQAVGSNGPRHLIATADPAADHSASSLGQSRPVRCVWHDGPEHELVARGLALSEQGGIWCIEDIRQRFPAEPAMPREQVSDIALLTTPVPTRTTAVAVFDGRARSVPIGVDQEVVMMTITRGVVRARAAEHPLCRVTLDGPDAAVRVVAERLATLSGTTVPRRTLAGEALALAGLLSDDAGAGWRIAADDHLTPSAAFRQILGALLLALLADMPAVLAGSRDIEPVHRMRVAVRRLRSAVSVFRPAIACPTVEHTNELLKSLGARLGPTRDWDVFVMETLPMVAEALPGNEALAALTVAAERRRQTWARDLRTYLGSAEFRVLTVGLAWLSAATAWVPAIPADGGEGDVIPFARHVLRRRTRRLLVDGEHIGRLDVPGLHGLRLRAKRTRYAAEMFAGLFPGRQVRRYVRRLSRLQEHLGVLNDAAVAHALLHELGAMKGRHAHAGGLVLGYAAHRITAVRPAILEAWMKFRQADAFWG